MFKDDLYHSKNWYSSTSNLQVHLVSNFTLHLLQFRAKMATCISDSWRKYCIFVEFENRFSLFNGDQMDKWLHWHLCNPRKPLISHCIILQRATLWLYSECNYMCSIHISVCWIQIHHFWGKHSHSQFPQNTSGILLHQRPRRIWLIMKIGIRHAPYIKYVRSAFSCKGFGKAE